MSSVLNSPPINNNSSGSNLTHRNNLNNVDNSNESTATPPSNRNSNSNNNNNNVNNRNNSNNANNYNISFLELFINLNIQIFQQFKQIINPNFNLFIVVSAISFIIFIIVNLTPVFLLWILAVIAVTGTFLQIWYGLRYNSRIIEVNGGYLYPGNNPYSNNNNRNNNNHPTRLFFPNSQFSRLSHLINPPLNLQLTLIDRDFNSNDYDMLLQLDNDIQPHGGAKKEQIDLLPIHYIDNQEDLDTFLNSSGGSNSKDLQQKVCSICLDEFAINDSIRTLPCIHHYHSSCIEKWLKIKSVCPVCKHEVIFD